MSEVKYAHRIPPCPAYDLECMESWLEDMAKEGLVLTQAGYFFDFLEFEVTTPKPIRYRLQPLPKKKFLEDRRPSDAALDLAEEYGWEYLCNLGEYAVFFCSDPHARELDTDPQIQRLGLEQLHRRKRSNLITLGVMYALCLVSLVSVGPLMDLLYTGIWKSVCSLLILILLPLICIHEFRQLQTIRRKLALGEPLSRTINWRKRRWKHHCLIFCFVFLYVSFLLTTLLGRFRQWPHSDWTSISDYTGTIPFATMEDLAGGGVFEPDGLYVEEDNHIAERTTLLAPRQIKLQQTGAVVQDGTTRLDGILEIQYCELRTNWLARELFREIRRNDDNSKHYQMHALSELPTEQEFAYSNYFPTLLLQDGNKVIKVQLTQFDSGQQLSLDQWAAIIATSLKE